MAHDAVVLLLSVEFPDGSELLHGLLLSCVLPDGTELLHGLLFILELSNGPELLVHARSLGAGILLQALQLVELGESVQNFELLLLGTTDGVDQEAFISGLVEDAGGSGHVDGGDLLL